MSNRTVFESMSSRTVVTRIHGHGALVTRYTKPVSGAPVVSQVFVPGGDQIPAPDFAGPEEVKTDHYTRY